MCWWDWKVKLVVYCVFCYFSVCVLFVLIVGSDVLVCWWWVWCVFWRLLWNGGCRDSWGWVLGFCCCVLLVWYRLVIVWLRFWWWWWCVLVWFLGCRCCDSVVRWLYVGLVGWWLRCIVFCFWLWCG